jgi:hypothetical protein
VPITVTAIQSADALPQGVQVERKDFEHEGKTFWVLNSIGSAVVAPGKYLYNPTSNQVEFQWIQGIGSQEAPAPQATLMATVINGILTQKLPWGLVWLGVFLVIAVELLGVRSLAFAVGSYLSIGTTLAIFVGGIVRWAVERGQAPSAEHSEEISPGSLYASGLIAAGGIVGLLGVFLKVLEKPPVDWMPRLPENVLQFQRFGITFLESNVVSVIMFALLAISAFYFARKPLETKLEK